MPRVAPEHPFRDFRNACPIAVCRAAKRAHIIGDRATDLIAEMTLARRLEATTEELIRTIHAHPTKHEAMHKAMREAALAAEGRVIHA